MKKINYKVICIVTLVICTVACFLELFANSLSLSDMAVRVTGVTCIVSLIINIFSFVKSYGKS